MLIHLQRVFLLAVTVFLLGCGKPAGMHVWGQVSWEGTPVEKGNILFTPIEGTTGPSTGGTIENGKYDLPEKGGPKPEGRYAVVITGIQKTGKSLPAFKSEDKRLVPEYTSIIPPEYNNKTELKVTISLDPTKNEFNFQLPTAKKVP